MGSRAPCIRRHLDTQPGVCIPTALVPIIRPAGIVVTLSSFHSLGGTFHHYDSGCIGIIAKITGGFWTFRNTAVRRDNIFPAYHPDIVYRPGQRLASVAGDDYRNPLGKR